MIDSGACWLSPEGILNRASFGHLEWIAPRYGTEQEIRALTDPETDRVALTQELYDRAYNAGYVRVVVGHDKTMRYNYIGAISAVQLIALEQIATDNEIRLLDDSYPQ